MNYILYKLYELVLPLTFLSELRDSTIIDINKTWIDIVIVTLVFDPHTYYHI